MSTATLTRKLLEEVDLLRTAQTNLEASSNDFATTERAYRLHSAIAYVHADGKNTDERKANAELHEISGRTLAEARYSRDMARGLKESALEAVRSSRTVISAIQSLIASERSEAELLRWGSREAVGA